MLVLVLVVLLGERRRGRGEARGGRRSWKERRREATLDVLLASQNLQTDGRTGGRAIESVCFGSRGRAERDG